MFEWKKLDKHYNLDLAVVSLGDKSCPPTRWWNHWWLLATGAWKHAVVIEVEPPADKHAMHTVGYDPFEGSAMCKRLDIMTAKVAFRMGYESCRFFAFDAQGNQLPLRVVTAMVPVVMLDEDVVLV